MVNIGLSSERTRHPSSFHFPLAFGRTVGRLEHTQCQPLAVVKLSAHEDGVASGPRIQYKLVFKEEAEGHNGAVRVWLVLLTWVCVCVCACQHG